MEQLWSVYREWKVLTEREGRAIQQNDWSSVHDTQELKRSLQSEIIHLTEQVNSDFRSKTEHDRFDSQLRGIVNELILLETQNNVTLQASIDVVNEQRRGLDATSTRLRQIHTRYVPSRNPVWENIS